MLYMSVADTVLDVRTEKNVGMIIYKAVDYLYNHIPAAIKLSRETKRPLRNIMGEYSSAYFAVLRERQENQTMDDTLENRQSDFLQNGTIEFVVEQNLPVIIKQRKKDVILTELINNGQYHFTGAVCSPLVLVSLISLIAMGIKDIPDTNSYKQAAQAGLFTGVGLLFMGLLYGVSEPHYESKGPKKISNNILERFKQNLVLENK